MHEPARHGGIGAAISRRLSRMASRSDRVPPAEAIEGFRRAQRLAYRCALEASARIRPGWTEKEAADCLGGLLHDAGVKAFFHRPFAWFGERSRFQGFKSFTDFLPTGRKLERPEVVILDCAPIVEGFAADIGYTFSLEPNPKLERARSRLLEFRREIPELFSSKATTKEIWERVDREMRDSGYDNCHALYPFSVLAHRVYEIPYKKLPPLSVPVGVLSWFTLHSYFAFLARGVFPELLGPNHSGAKTGLWAIEPHLGAEGFGAKFEEILVVEADRAYWLDDDVPHVRPARPE